MKFTQQTLLLVFASCAALWNYIIAAPGDYGFISAGDSLYNISMDTQIIQKLPISDLSFPAGVDCDPVEGKIYWAEYWGNKIGRCDLDGGNQEPNLITDTGPFGLALDVSNRWIYWSAERSFAAAAILRANMDGTSQTVIVNIAPASPKHIALDTSQNKIYWTDIVPPAKIRRANLDGSGVETLISSNLQSITGIALDIQAGLVFWCDGGAHNIESYNLATTQRSLIYSTPEITPYALALYEQDIFWVDESQPGLKKLPIDGSTQVPENFGTGPNQYTDGVHGLRIKSDVCSTLGDICKNSGVCVNQPSGTDLFTCQCTINYEGRLCETLAEVRRCATPQVPAQGFISHSSFEVGSSVFFICNTGYEIVGASQATCRSDLTWSVQSPTCALTCTSLTPPVNGAITPARGPYFVNTQVTFTCNSGYRLLGISSISCMPSGAWSSLNFPSCTEIVTVCPPLVQPINGKIVPQQSSYDIQQTITFQCNDGYQILGATSAVCQADGSWSHPTPTCQSVSCLAPPSPIQGSLQPDQSSYSIGQQVNFVCNDGYQIVGQPLFAVCLQGGIWSDSTPQCEDLTCDAPLRPNDVNISPELLFYQIGQQVEFQCNGGFQRFGSDSTTCMADGSWSNPSPTCQETTCTTPVQPLNGGISPALASYAIGQLVQYRCDYGYKPIGADFTMCLANGAWSTTPPHCQVSEIICTAPPQPQSGDISPLLFSYQFGQPVTFQCNNGYYIDGEETLRCIAVNTWSAAPPVCQAITCTAPAQPRNGHISPVLSTYAFGQQVSITCDIGYQLIGAAISVCSQQNTWSNPEPVCQAISCAAPAHPQNGEISPTLSSYAFQQRVEFTCNSGYFLNGQESITCISVNTWSSQFPTCQAITCTAPAHPTNGYIAPVLTIYAFKQEVTFGCNEGYRLIGDASASCVSPNMWSNSVPPCEELTTCIVPIIPINGNIKPALNFYQVGAEVSFECDTGYRLLGDAMVTCLQNGEWSNLSPTCQVVTCRPPTLPINGQISPDLSSYSIGQQVEFQCDNNYQLNGLNSVFCLYDGTWSSDTPSCQEITCSVPIQPINGRVTPFVTKNPIGQQLIFSCNTGFQISGSERIVCRNDGTWSNPFPRCVESVQTTCIPPAIPANGNISPSSLTSFPIGQRITFSCNPGYDLEGTAEVDCTSDGSWSTIFPTCVVHVTCPAPDIPISGTISPSSGPYDQGQQVVFSCSSGFQLRGVPAVVCQDDGTWTDPSPTCVLQEKCQAPDIPDNGYVVPPGQIPRGDTVNFVCYSGYQLQGAGVAICLESLEWNVESPTCVAIDTMCNAPSPPNNGRIEPSKASYSVNEDITFTCNTGYQLVGSSMAKCTLAGLTASWSFPTPVCIEEVVECPAPDPFPNGNVIPAELPSYPSGERVTFQCNIGYELQGTAEIICTRDGTWSSNQPTCGLMQTTCPPISSLPNGNVSPAAEPHLVGVSIIFSCNSGYQLQGLGTIVCTLDGTWSSEDLPECVEMVCDAPGLFPNGHIMPNEGPYSVGYKINFECSEGFTLVGLESSVCTNMREWSSEIPLCMIEEPTCVNPTVTSNLIILPQQGPYKIGEVITFACANGYDIIGEISAVCTIERTWSVQSPTCVKNVCEIRRPTNGILEGYPDDTTEIPVGTSVTITCNKDYVLEGQWKLTCTKERILSDQAPACKAENDNGNVGNLFGDEDFQIILWAVVPSVVIIILVILITCVLCCRRRRRRESALRNEHLIMAYRKQNRNLPSAQGTEEYNIYGGRDNRPMNMRNIEQEDPHYQESLPRSQLTSYPGSHQTTLRSNPESNRSLPRLHPEVNRSLPPSHFPESSQSLPRSVGLPRAESSGPEYINLDQESATMDRRRKRNPMNQLTRV